MSVKMFVKKHFSKILILAGLLCVIGYVAQELLAYPWARIYSDNPEEFELPDPPPPSVNYIISTPPPGYNSNQNTGDLPGGSYTGDDNENALIKLDFDIMIPLASAPSEDEPLVVLGIIKIQRLGLSEYLWQGTGDLQFKNGVGHVNDTAMPDEKGNVVIAAHRSSSSGMQPFRYLDELKNGDLISIKYWGKTYWYEVYESFVVGKEDYWVLEDIPGESNTLTMITCDPLIYIGHRPRRLIVRARLLHIVDDVAAGGN